MSEDNSDFIKSTAIMAAGTIVSRFTGLIRNLLTVAALGTALFADTFNVANTIPTILYILLAGGALNAVFVPQLVRSMREDGDVPADAARRQGRRQRIPGLEGVEDRLVVIESRVCGPEHRHETRAATQPMEPLEGLRRPAPRLFAIVCLSLVCPLTSVTSAQSTANPSPRTDDQPVQLSAFEVSTDRDTAYRVNNSVSSNRANTALFDTPQSITVLTEEFLRDIEMIDLNEALVFIPGVVEGQAGVGGDNPIESRGQSMTRLLDNMPDESSNVRTDTALVERVEVLKDGASAIYGADATAGVVNVILRKDYSGAEVGVSYGNSFKTDVAEKTYSFFGGAASGKASATVGISYFERAALRASELHADIIMKATKVDGIYDKDPKKHTDAVKYDQLTFIDALKQRLNVMDSTAFSLCMDNNVPILVFDLNDEHSIRKAIVGEKIGTLVKN